MTKELYEVVKPRISVITPDINEWELVKEDFNERGWTFDPNCPLYRIHVSDLGEDYFDIVQPIRSRNMWNVAQRLYSNLFIHEGIEVKLLQSKN